ncbi:EF-hand protein (macronuclear) [Tetrahymena thermophila SB210]|uniref:EF-hand protein n=1 Tax=Tetrahymena thermophila (strain SB210) TaxID=312017 RepID=Q231F9_TETTS|nr:EF-hand protein [Tetrahymena thermophila SB210]EAR91080.2 EF-hand protein [Tetrahymena thermophila SB210]|eukprot:XP_001011325.2 EF-hand protein [Tetrahymena thermophila SB210]
MDLTQGLDYKELQKTLIQFQKAQMQLERTGKLSPLKQLSPFKKKEMVNFKALEEAGLINLNFPSSKEKVQGVQISLEDIEKAFKILDEKNGGSKISLQELKRKIPDLNPNFPLNEIPALTQGKSEIKSKELFELLKQNELDHFDPLQEAFNLLDPNKTDTLDMGRLKKVFQVLGYADLDPKDISILEECLNVKGEKSGKITLKDLREIFENE